MVKKSKGKLRQKQKQSQSQTVNVIVKPSAKKRAPRKKAVEVPMRQLPPVVYQTLPQLTYYTTPTITGAIVAKSPPPSSITSPPPPKTSILEDIGMIGTEGPVSILELPTKKEILTELTTPVPVSPMPVSRPPLNIVPEKKPIRQPKILDIPPVVIDTVESGKPFLSDILLGLNERPEPTPLFISQFKEKEPKNPPILSYPPVVIDPVESGTPNAPPAVIIDPVQSGAPSFNIVMKTPQSIPSFENQISGEKFLPESVPEPSETRKSFKIGRKEKFITDETGKKTIIKATTKKQPPSGSIQSPGEMQGFAMQDFFTESSRQPEGIMMQPSTSRETFIIPPTPPPKRKYVRTGQFIGKSQLQKERKEARAQMPPVPAIAEFTGQSSTPGFFTSQNMPSSVQARLPEEVFGIESEQVYREPRIRQTSPRPTAKMERSKSIQRMRQNTIERRSASATN